MALAAPGLTTAVGDEGLRVEAGPGGYRVTGGSVDHDAADAWEAAHWILHEALGATAEAVAGAAILNAGAVLLGGCAVVFAGESHAGKSSVALHLAASGLALLGDDRLLLAAADRPPTAIALGLARKVRTPLPDDFSLAARSLAARARAGHAGGADILAWDPAIDAAAGTVAAVGRILVVRRDPALSAPRVVDLGAAEAVAALLPLCGRHAGTAAELLDAITRLVRAVPVNRLETPTAATAAEHLASSRLAPCR